MSGERDGWLVDMIYGRSVRNRRVRRGVVSVLQTAAASHRQAGRKYYPRTSHHNPGGQGLKPESVPVFLQQIGHSRIHPCELRAARDGLSVFFDSVVAVESR